MENFAIYNTFMKMTRIVLNFIMENMQYMTNDTYLLIFGKSNDDFVEFFYCDYNEDNIGYSFADKKCNIYSMETVFCISKSYLITPHLPIPGKYYFNIKSYKELCDMYILISKTDDFIAEFDMVEDENSFNELCLLDKPVITLKPNKSCIDLVPKLIFIPSKYNK